MQIALFIIIGILFSIIIYQQNNIWKMEDQVYNALKVTCETLELIKKNSSLEDILEMQNENTFT